MHAGENTKDKNQLEGNAPKVMGHMEPCRAQFAILSSVESTYSARFEGVSKLSWFEPCFAMCVMGSAGSVECVGTLAGAGAGGDEWSWREAGRTRIFCAVRRSERGAGGRAAENAP